MKKFVGIIDRKTGDELGNELGGWKYLCIKVTDEDYKEIMSDMENYNEVWCDGRIRIKRWTTQLISKGKSLADEFLNWIETTKED